MTITPALKCWERWILRPQWSASLCNMVSFWFSKRLCFKATMQREAEEDDWCSFRPLYTCSLSSLGDYQGWCVCVYSSSCTLYRIMFPQNSKTVQSNINLWWHILWLIILMNVPHVFVMNTYPGGMVVFPLIAALAGRGRLISKFKNSLVSIVNSRLAKAKEWEFFLNVYSVL